MEEAMDWENAVEPGRIGTRRYAPIVKGKDRIFPRTCVLCKALIEECQADNVEADE